MDSSQMNSYTIAVKLQLKFILALLIKNFSQNMAFIGLLSNRASVTENDLDPYGLVALVAWCSVSFYMTYYVCYGYSMVMVDWDGIKVFETNFVACIKCPYSLEISYQKAHSYPKCVARIHQFSDLWRSFDYGMYAFIKK